MFILKKLGDDICKSTSTTNTSKMNPQEERDYLLSMSHMTDVQLLRESDELHALLDKGELAESDKKSTVIKIQIIFGAILRREAFDEMEMDELNKCISDNEREREELEEKIKGTYADIHEESKYWNAYIWEADARAEFMRRMEKIVHGAFTEESSDYSSDES
jgi:vacuolar-type H+-ATPase subunit I/STV1